MGSNEISKAFNSKIPDNKDTSSNILEEFSIWRDKQKQDWRAMVSIALGSVKEGVFLAEDELHKIDELGLTPEEMEHISQTAKTLFDEYKSVAPFSNKQLSAALFEENPDFCTNLGNELADFLERRKSFDSSEVLRHPGHFKAGVEGYSRHLSQFDRWMNWEKERQFLDSEYLRLSEGLKLSAEKLGLPVEAIIDAARPSGQSLQEKSVFNPGEIGNENWFMGDLDLQRKANVMLSVRTHDAAEQRKLNGARCPSSDTFDF